MKRILVGAFIGAILVFGWQAISHMVMHHHDVAYRQLPGQENAIKMLSGMFKEEGQYLIPRAGINASQQEMENFDAAMKGKPWAIVTYHPAYSNNMGLAIIRSFIIAMISVMLLIYVMGKNPGRPLKVYLKSLAWGCFAFIFVWYNNNIWLQTPWDVIKGELIDLAVAWSLCGLWLAYWLKNKQPKTMGYGKGFGI